MTKTRWQICMEMMMGSLGVANKLFSASTVPKRRAAA